MKLNWPGHGRKVYDYPDRSVIALEWLHLDGETYYKLFGIRNDIRRIILEFRIPDNMWMDVEPKFYGDF